jgi:histidinol-phosphate aminotransferase
MDEGVSDPGAPDPLRHVKPAVRSLAAYTLAMREAPVKINQNENPWELPEAVKRRVVERALARPWARYPDFDPQELLESLARHAGWCSDGVLAGNGSNEMIEALLLVTVGGGSRVVIPEPTFTLYALLTRILGGEPVRVRQVPAGPAAGGAPASGAPVGLVYDVEALLAARRESGATVTIVCSPNNPTGSALSLAEIERLCDAGDSLVVIDEAYHEFSGASAVPLLARHPNLVVLRTFSKAKALAGLRVGYLLASPDLVREINKARLPYNINFFSQAAALAALEEKESLAASLERIVAGREWLRTRLADLPGVRAWPSRANFFILELLSADPKAVFASLLRHGVLVRDVTSYPMLSRCLRVSVGSEEENETFLRSLGSALGEAGMDLSLGRA